jgi:hypothetical protein
MHSGHIIWKILERDGIARRDSWIVFRRALDAIALRRGLFPIEDDGNGAERRQRPQRRRWTIAGDVIVAAAEPSHDRAGADEHDPGALDRMPRRCCAQRPIKDREVQRAKPKHNDRRAPERSPHAKSTAI